MVDKILVVYVYEPEDKSSIRICFKWNALFLEL